MKLREINRSNRKESTEKKVGMEFTKPEDPEQRVADPWIKKMQEISRQKREKWAAYKRNENGKLALDNVEETTRASKLTNDESITIPALSKGEEYDENVMEKSSVSRNLFEESDESLEVNLDPAISKSLAQHSANQDTADVKNFSHKRHRDYLIPEVKDLTDKENAADSEELEEDRLFSAINSHSADSISQELKNKHIPTNTRTANFANSPKSGENLHDKNNYKKSAKEHPNESSTSDNEKGKRANNEDDKINLLMQKIKKIMKNVNLHHSEPISQHSKNRHIPKTPINTHKNLRKLPKSNEKLNHRNGSGELSAKEHLQRSNPSHDDNEKTNEDSKGGDEKITMMKPSTRKSEEKKEERKDVTEEPLNHEGSFHPGRWGMSVSSPPAEFLKDMSRRSMHRKNKEQTEGEKDGRQHAPDRWGMSVTSPPKEFLEDIATHQGRERLTMETRSRPNEVEGFSDDRSSAPQSRQNLQMDLVRATADGRDKEFTEAGRVPSGFYNFRYQRLNTWGDYVDFNGESFLRKLKLVIQTLQVSDIDPICQCDVMCRFLHNLGSAFKEILFILLLL